jgi:predicted transcriptional regulator
MENVTASTPEGIGTTIGAQVRRLREFRALSLADLARLSGVSRATLSILESGRGNPTVETVSPSHRSLFSTVVRIARRRASRSCSTGWARAD